MEKCISEQVGWLNGVWPKCQWYKAKLWTSNNPSTHFITTQILFNNQGKRHLQTLYGRGERGERNMKKKKKKDPIKTNLANWQFTTL